jgi:hypothetical protein
MSFIVQISPFVYLFTLKIVFRWGGFAGPAGSFKRPPDHSPQVVPTFHFIPSYAPGCFIHNFYSFKTNVFFSFISLQVGPMKGGFSRYIGPGP